MEDAARARARAPHRGPDAHAPHRRSRGGGARRTSPRHERPARRQRRAHGRGSREARRDAASGAGLQPAPAGGIQRRRARRAPGASREARAERSCGFRAARVSLRLEPIPRVRASAASVTACSSARDRLRRRRARSRPCRRRLRRDRHRSARARRPDFPSTSRSKRSTTSAPSTRSSPASRSTTSRASARRSTRSPRSCGPEARSSCRSSHGRDSAAPRRGGTTSSDARRTRTAWPRASTRGSHESEHDLADVHPFSELRRELDRLFVERVLEEVPYLYSHRLDDAVEPVERALIEAGAIEATGVLYAGELGG